MMRKVSVFECEGNIALDGEFLELMSDSVSEFAVELKHALMDEEAYQALLEADSRVFKHRLYDSMLEADLQHTASEYAEEHIRSIDKKEWGIETFRTMEQLERYLAEEELMMTNHAIELTTYHIGENLVEFEVSKSWLQNQLEELTVEDFLLEYTYDSTFPIYEDAKAENKLISEKIIQSDV